jgi:hypothetical protein
MFFHITDFKHGFDNIDLGAILPTSFHAPSLKPLKGLGDIHYSYQGANTLLEISTDSDAGAEMQILLHGHVGYLKSDFVL